MKTPMGLSDGNPEIRAAEGSFDGAAKKDSLLANNGGEECTGGQIFLLARAADLSWT